MRHLNKKLVATAAATALMAARGAAVAQSADNTIDPMATPQQQVDVNAPDGSGNHIYFFRDQGNSPESDPAAHLLLIKHEQWHAVPVAESTTTTTTTVAQATTPADPVPTAMPAASDASTTETVAAPMDTAPALAPKADRN